MANEIGSPVQTCGNNNHLEDDPKDKTKFINVKIADKENGKGFQEVVLHIDLGGGEFFEPTTDENGEMKLFVKDSGTYKLEIDWKRLVTEKIPLSQMLIVQ